MLFNIYLNLIFIHFYIILLYYIYIYWPIIISLLLFCIMLGQ